MSEPEDGCGEVDRHSLARRGSTSASRALAARGSRCHEGLAARSWRHRRDARRLVRRPFRRFRLRIAWLGLRHRVLSARDLYTRTQLFGPLAGDAGRVSGAAARRRRVRVPRSTARAENVTLWRWAETHGSQRCLGPATRRRCRTRSRTVDTAAEIDTSPQNVCATRAARPASVRDGGASFRLQCSKSRGARRATAARRPAVEHTLTIDP